MNAEDTPVLDVEDRFAIVPEWVLDAAISDAAVRLYAVLLRFGQTSGARMPARSTLARRMHKKSTDTVDRAMRELVELGAVVVQHRFDGGQRLTNKYLVRTSRPRDNSQAGRGVAARMRLPQPLRLAALPRLPARPRVRVAAPLRRGWPHRCGITQSSSPKVQHPLPPPPPRTATMCLGRGRRRRTGSSTNAESTTGTVSSPTVRRCDDNSANQPAAGLVTAYSPRSSSRCEPGTGPQHRRKRPCCR